MIAWLRMVLWNLTHPNRMPRCRHGFAPDQGLGLWCPGCER